jgi:polyferredoxin
MPGEGQERLAELTRIAGQTRTTRARGLPLLLWRLRGAFGSVRDVAGVALPFRVLTPWFLAMSAIAALLCVLLCGIVLVVLVVAAVA